MADDDQPPLILVDDRQSAPLDVDGLVALARECLIGEGAADTELSVSLVTEDEMADLHERYMDEPGPTDVSRSRSMRRTSPATARRLLGDVVIAPAVAARNNPADPAAELRLLLAHGILHLLGHDHEADAERSEMWALQERYSGASACRDLALGARRGPRGPRVGPGGRRGVAHPDDPRPRARARRGGAPERRHARADRGRPAAVPELDLPDGDARARTARRSSSRSSPNARTAASASRSSRSIFTLLYFVIVEAMSKTFGVLHGPGRARARAARVVPRPRARAADARR